MSFGAFRFARALLGRWWLWDWWLVGYQWRRWSLWHTLRAVMVFRALGEWSGLRLRRCWCMVLMLRLV